MRFVVDAQLPPGLARWLTWQGHEAEHVSACGLSRASDSAIWAHALQTGSVIVTKDEDFAQRKGFDPTGPAVLWIRIRNTRRREILSQIERAWPRVIDALLAGERLVEVR